MKPSRKTLTLVLICWGIIACGWAGYQFYYFSVFTVDDAYISYQYAENFAQGKGLVFNVGEYVEGYTNFLWVILLSVFNKIGVDVRKASLALGVVFSLGTLLLLSALSQQISSKLFLGDKLKWINQTLNMYAILCVATSPAFGIWTVAGLETPLFLCLLTSAIWLHLRGRTRTNWEPFSSMSFGFLALTRPEGLLYFGLTVMYSLGHELLFQRIRFSHHIKSILVFLCFVIPHFLWRWYYYGSLLPNTYYIKVGREFYFTGVKYVYEFFFAYGGAGLVLVCCLFLISQRFHEYWVGYVLMLLGVSITYFMKVGGDWMPEFRFFVPLLPLFFLCLQEGLREILRILPNTTSRWGVIGAALLLLVIPCNNLFLFYQAPRMDSQYDGHVIIGNFLRDHSKPDDVVAAIDIGAIAYFSGLRTIDYFGLVDAHIARLTPQSYTFEHGFWGHDTFALKSDIEYVLAQHPRFIELNTTNNPERTDQAIPADPYSAIMWRHPVFQHQYVPVLHTSGTTMFVTTSMPED